MSPPPVLVWFRNDLRLDDNEALTRAVATGQPVIPVYCLDPRHFRTTRLGWPKTGAHRARFLIEGLQSLRKELQRAGSDLVIRRGHPEVELLQLVQTTQATDIFYHEEATDEELQVERALAVACEDVGVTMHASWGATLHHPEDLPGDVADIPEVFTRFRKGIEKYSRVRAPLPPIRTLRPWPSPLERGDLPSLVELDLEAPRHDARSVLRFEGGEGAALGRLRTYLWTNDCLRDYKKTRNGLLGADYSSKFSPWLAQGSLSPRRVYAEVQEYESERVRNDSTYWLVFELRWRDFFRFLAIKHGTDLFKLDGIKHRRLTWRQNETALRAWCRGETGIPFIDANMRELSATGFMSNRGRQNVASFFSKNLLIDWRWGASYFESQLLDYDPCSNYGNWQYVSGVGSDPRDRYFNIVGQANRYDKAGDYVRHWLPELATLPAPLIHAPGDADPRHVSAFGVTLGVNYPNPIINLDRSYEALKRGAR